MQHGDVLSTHASTECLQNDLGYLPQIGFQEGIERFVEWYLSFYH